MANSMEVVERSSREQFQMFRAEQAAAEADPQLRVELNRLIATRTELESRTVVPIVHLPDAPTRSIIDLTGQDAAPAPPTNEAVNDTEVTNAP
ncbi:hypothetical protein CYMTET_24087 [Cymbomonas tetramitiformis]|uniref:Uncharacterized protein n=1 Tax=Cymbomonas tetramitiformis TaxID=36881 RepID=A0AAE0L0F1_9CHLO|nr:hypothetical protein CYMTET_24087 [Cymbomonas tetramitiformis]